MVAKCANPDCDARFLYFREGQLFVTYRNSNGGSEERSAAICPRFFWLCEYCATRMTLKFDTEGTPIILRRNVAEWQDHCLIGTNSQLHETKIA
jgi:hypothetical protein